MTTSDGAPRRRRRRPATSSDACTLPTQPHPLTTHARRSPDTSQRGADTLPSHPVTGAQHGQQPVAASEEWAVTSRSAAGRPIFGRVAAGLRPAPPPAPGGAGSPKRPREETAGSPPPPPPPPPPRPQPAVGVEGLAAERYAAAVAPRRAPAQPAPPQPPQLPEDELALAEFNLATVERLGITQALVRQQTLSVGRSSCRRTRCGA